RLTMHISALWQYPVKSCRGLQQPMLPLVAGGLFGDRRWMIVGDQYQFLTQRQLPNMVKIFAVLEEGELRLRFNDQKLRLPQSDGASSDRGENIPTDPHRPVRGGC
ncbi:MAG: hypothetical protein EBY50_01365, partial [Rhodobacteraceae bacterium]|nr:hypothetical protein [Paracoccaceae bacterium]